MWIAARISFIPALPLSSRYPSPAWKLFDMVVKDVIAEIGKGI